MIREGDGAVSRKEYLKKIILRVSAILLPISLVCFTVAFTFGMLGIFSFPRFSISVFSLCCGIILWYAGILLRDPLPFFLYGDAFIPVRAFVPADRSWFYRVDITGYLALFDALYRYLVHDRRVFAVSPATCRVYCAGNRLYRPRFCVPSFFNLCNSCSSGISGSLVVPSSDSSVCHILFCLAFQKEA